MIPAPDGPNTTPTTVATPLAPGSQPPPATTTPYVPVNPPTIGSPTVTSPPAAVATGSTTNQTSSTTTPPTDVQSMLDILTQEYANGGGLIGQSGTGVVALPTPIAPTSSSGGMSNKTVMLIVIALALGYWYYRKHKKQVTA